ncbi:copia-type polyprotein [Tanacetum coccineum]
MLEGKLVFVSDDGVPMKPLNFNGQATIMELFTCFSDMFDTPNTSTKVATAGTSDTPSNNGEDGSVNMIKGDKLNDMRPAFYVNRMESVLENGPWLICNMPLILRKWSPSTNVWKEDLKSVSVWVKLYDVPITVFMEDALSDVTRKIDTPLMLDTYIQPQYQCLKLKVMDIYSILFELSTSENRLDVQLVRQTKPKDTNSNKVSSNNNSGSKSIVDVASSSGTKIVTSNPFDVLNMVDKDIGVAPSDSVNSKGDDVNVGNSSSKSEGGTGMKSLSGRWKENYDDTSYEDDEEHGDLTDEQLAFFGAFDVSLRGQIRR